MVRNWFIRIKRKRVKYRFVTSGTSYFGMGYWNFIIALVRIFCVLKNIKSLLNAYPPLVKVCLIENLVECYPDGVSSPKVTGLRKPGQSANPNGPGVVSSNAHASGNRRSTPNSRTTGFRKQGQSVANSNQPTEKLVFDAGIKTLKSKFDLNANEMQIIDRINTYSDQLTQIIEKALSYMHRMNFHSADVTVKGSSEQHKNSAAADASYQHVKTVIDGIQSQISSSKQKAADAIAILKILNQLDARNQTDRNNYFADLDEKSEEMVAVLNFDEVEKMMTTCEQPMENVRNIETKLIAKL